MTTLVTRPEIARQLGVSPQAVHKWTLLAGFPQPVREMESVVLRGVKVYDLDAVVAWKQGRIDAGIGIGGV